MIESIHFSNFKALKNVELPLAPFTLLLGPNGSGKSTVLQALQSMPAFASGARGDRPVDWNSLVNVSSQQSIEIKARLTLAKDRPVAEFSWQPHAEKPSFSLAWPNRSSLDERLSQRCAEWLSRIRVYALDAEAIKAPVQVGIKEIQPNGAGLAGVLDNVHSNHRSRWKELEDAIRHWLPEYDEIQFDTPIPGHKAIALRTVRGGHRIPASELSQGTRVSLALLTLAYLPEPPTVIGLEEIDRALHPRLLRHLQDALYRLSYPESCGESRAPIQVVATTHSPYLVDLYREHPEEIVLAQKEELEVKFQRLTDIEHYEEILGDSALGNVWYSGVLGGVSVKP